MAESYGPFDGPPWSQSQWYDVAPYWAPSGVLGAAAATVGSGDLALTANGLTASLGTGRAWVRGAGYKNDAAKAFTVTANSNSNPRIDRIVLRRDLAAKTVTAIRLQGTPAAAPVVPALTQSDSGQWDLPLFRFTVPPNSGTTLTALTDDRAWVDALSGTSSIEGKMWRTSGASGTFGTLTSLRLAVDSARVSGGFRFDTATDMLTVPADGFYDLSGCVYWYGTGTWSSTSWIERTRAGVSRVIVGGEVVNKTTTYDTRQYMQNRLPLMAGDQLCLVVYAYDAPAQYYGSDEVNTSWLAASYVGPLNGAVAV